MLADRLDDEEMTLNLKLMLFLVPQRASKVPAATGHDYSLLLLSSSLSMAAEATRSARLPTKMTMLRNLVLNQKAKPINYCSSCSRSCYCY